MAVADILISPAQVYVAATSAAQPTTAIGYGSSWGTAWTSLGYTLEPVSLEYDRTIYELEVQQVMAPVKRVVQKEIATIETVLAEATATNLRYAMNGTVTTTAAGAGKGYDTVEAGGATSLPEYQWGFEGFRVDAAGTAQPVRLFFYKGVAAMNGPMRFAKNAGVGIPVQVQAAPDLSKAAGKQMILMQIVTAPAT